MNWFIFKESNRALFVSPSQSHTCTTPQSSAMANWATSCSLLLPSEAISGFFWRRGWGPNLLQYKDNWWYSENQFRILCLEEGKLKSNSGHQDESLPPAKTFTPVPLPAFLQSVCYNYNKGHIFPISKVFTLLNSERETPELNRHGPGGAALSPGPCLPAQHHSQRHPRALCECAALTVISKHTAFSNE